MSLKEQGFRFVRREPHFVWLHSAEVGADDVDCTDMTDDQFLEFFDQCKKNQADRQQQASQSP